MAADGECRHRRRRGGERRLLVRDPHEAIAFEAAVLRPLSWALDRESVDRWIKVGSVLALLVGFHFDLLAS